MKTGRPYCKYQNFLYVYLFSVFFYKNLIMSTDAWNKRISKYIQIVPSSCWGPIDNCLVSPPHCNASASVRLYYCNVFVILSWWPLMSGVWESHAAAERVTVKTETVFEVEVSESVCSVPAPIVSLIWRDAHLFERRLRDAAQRTLTRALVSVGRSVPLHTSPSDSVYTVDSLWTWHATGGLQNNVIQLWTQLVLKLNAHAHCTFIHSLSLTSVHSGAAALYTAP